MLSKEVKLSLNLILTLLIYYIVYVNSYYEKKPGIIYILTWTDWNKEPFRFWSSKSKSLKLLNCEFQNCYIVKHKDYFADVTDYDVLLFNVMGISNDLPLVRSTNQLYVFVALEPAAHNPLGEEWNSFFNYTFTYKLDSDIVYLYFTVRNRRGEIVAPKIDTHWKDINKMRPTGKSVIKKLKNKTTAAAWFVTNCYNMNKRLGYVHRMNNVLNEYNQSLDIYGRCGNKVCYKDRFEDCLDMVDKEFYFYLAFENSDSEDYVTEKLMTALDHYAVPVVLGGANYSRFMPDGIYINANKLTEKEVAEKMHEIIQDKQKYYDYFRWHQYYSYQLTAGSGDSDPLCAFCAFLNDEIISTNRRVYARFDKWWNEDGHDRKLGDFIENFKDSGPHTKHIRNYMQKQIEIQTIIAPSALEEVINLAGDLLNYYFES